MYKEEEKLEHGNSHMGGRFLLTDIDKAPMREQDPKERRNNFKEVALGYN